ncbi:hypothetical protein CL619_02975 [archaeon]|nr:hypothetical protein [archaeon]|tara:strand:+ start:948 stop:1289 length:342 start_codon:yes stop_codon:yes gene_type:complete
MSKNLKKTTSVLDNAPALSKTIKELFILSKCKTKAAYSTRLKFQQYKLDLKKLVKEFEVIMETPIVLVIKVDDIELTAHNFGELLFRGCDNLELMQKIAEKVYQIGLVEKGKR